MSSNFTRRLEGGPFLCVFFPCLPGLSPLSPASPKRCRRLLCAPPDARRRPVGWGRGVISRERGQRRAPRISTPGPARDPRPRKRGARVPRPPLPTHPRPDRMERQSSPGGLSARLNGNIASKSRFRERLPIRSPAKPRVSPPARPRSRLESLELDESYSLVCARKFHSGFIHYTLP